MRPAWGERSSRRIERLCERDVAFRVLTANQRPDHTTVARFRQTHKTALARLFAQVLRLCGEAGLVKVGVVALDGTKVEANAALAANRTAETIAKDMTTMLAEAQAVDDAEDRRYGPDQRGDELPEALRHRTSRLARLKREATETAAQQQAKSEGRQAEEAATGQKEARTGADGPPDCGGCHGHGECDGPREPDHEDPTRVHARVQRPGGSDRRPDHCGGRRHAGGQ